MTEYTTRNLTIEESDQLVRSLTVKLGTHTLAMSALSVVAELGLGVFVAEETPDVDAAEAILAEGTPTADGGLVLEPSPRNR